MKNILLKTGGKLIVIRIVIGSLAAILALGMNNIILSPLFILLSVSVFTMDSGIEVDLENNRIRSYFSSLSIRQGKWGRFDVYNVITIKKDRKAATTYGGRASRSITEIDYYYDVYLSSENFRTKLLLFSSKDIEQSKKEAEKWSVKFSLPIIKYAPKPSQKTLRRRNR